HSMDKRCIISKTSIDERDKHIKPLLLIHRPTPSQNHSLSLHDALPISSSSPNVSERWSDRPPAEGGSVIRWAGSRARNASMWKRSEEHTSELQSRENIVCRLLLEKKKNNASIFDIIVI